MNTFQTYLIPCAKLSRSNAEILLKDIPAENFASKPRFGDKIIDTNHPAFVYGHLALYPETVLNMLGGDGESLKPPSGFTELFKNGCPCQDDPDCKIYPAMSVITESFFKGYDGLISALSDLDQSCFLKPTLDEKRVGRFPTVGAFAAFILSGHMMLHFGQVSAWRRCFGLGAA